VRPPTDLHADDLHRRLTIGSTLRGLRMAAGLSQADVWEKLTGVRSQEAMSRLECARPAWFVDTVQRWARILGWRLDLRLTGFPTPDLPPDPLAAVRPARPDLADAWDVAALVRQILGVRRALHLTQEGAGRVVGMTSQGWADFEAARWERTRLSVLQRNARALAFAADGRPAGYPDVRHAGHLDVQLVRATPPAPEEAR
jgi:transcriptional regulator with XRE-family HTH domain